jgi:hypothetical protein
MVTMLSSGAAGLALSADASGWCEVELRLPDRRYSIGADSERVVVGRLLQGLAPTLSGPGAGAIGGMEVKWVLSLAERHTTIYAADYEGNRLLFLQDADANLIGRIELTDPDRRRWVDTLEARAKLTGA